jgi:hypothetical protein
MSSLVQRLVVTGTATVGALALFSGTAFAHECYLGTKNLNGPKSANWEHITIPQGAAMFGLVTDPCDDQVAAGLDALQEAGLPQSIKIFMKSTLAANAAEHTLSDGKGMEHFTQGSTLADDALSVYAAAANAAECGAV